MNDNEIIIKTMKSNFRHTSDLSVPVICHLIKSLNMQEDYSAAIVDRFKVDGYEVISPKKQGRFWYEIPQKNILLSSSLCLGSVLASVFYPLYSIPLISLGVFLSGYTYYYRNYFYQNIQEGYLTLQESREDMGAFLKSVISLKKQIQETSEDIIPIDIKAKNTKHKLTELIDLIGYSIYLNVDNSNSIKVIDVIKALDSIKSVFSSGSHPELYFYEAMSKYANKQVSDEKSEASYEGSLDLGDKPDFSFKEDAISEGIRIAKQLNSEGKKPKAGLKKSKSKDVDKKVNHEDVDKKLKTSSKSNGNGRKSPDPLHQLFNPMSAPSDDELSEVLSHQSSTEQSDDQVADPSSTPSNYEEVAYTNAEHSGDIKLETPAGDPFDDLGDSDDLPEAAEMETEDTDEGNDDPYDELYTKLKENE